MLQLPNTCLTCHVASAQGSSRPPVLFADASNRDLDRNGDGVVDATDDAAFYAEVRGRINFTDLGASALLRKPAGHHHAGDRQPGFDDTAQPGMPLRASYDLLLNWMLNGAPR